MFTIHTDYKFVIAINKAIDIGVALNAASHSALSIAAQANDEQKKLMVSFLLLMPMALSTLQFRDYH